LRKHGGKNVPERQEAMIIQEYLDACFLNGANSVTGRTGRFLFEGGVIDVAMIEVNRIINASLEDVWKEVSSFGEPVGTINVALRSPGDPAKNGAGCERVITFGNRQIHELIEEVEPKRSFSYSILSGAPVKAYHGQAEFLRNGNRTSVHWSGEFTARIPGTSWIVARQSKKNINTLINELERTTRH
jgi:hypothetical protein